MLRTVLFEPLSRSGCGIEDGGGAARIAKFSVFHRAFLQIDATEKATIRRDFSRAAVIHLFETAALSPDPESR
jgi:hypothetical protein